MKIRDFSKKAFINVKKFFKGEYLRKRAHIGRQAQKTKTTTLRGKEAQIAIGYRKMRTFFARGIRLNPLRPQVRKQAIKKPKRLTKYFFKLGDAGYFRSTGKPVPYRGGTLYPTRY